MPRFISLVVGALLLLWCIPASADWLKDCQTGGPTTHSLGGTGKIACHRYDGSTADDDPAVLQVSDCDQTDILYYPDYDGDGSDSGGAVDVYTCPTSMIGETTEATLLNACQPLNGGTTLDAANTEAIGWGMILLWFDVEDWDDDNELQVKCNVGPQ